MFVRDNFCLLCVTLTRQAQELPSEKDTPETLRAKMGGSQNGIAKVPLPTTGAKFGRKDERQDSNPFGYSQDDEEHYWYVLHLEPVPKRAWCGLHGH